MRLLPLALLASAPLVADMAAAEPASGESLTKPALLKAAQSVELLQVDSALQDLLNTLKPQVMESQEAQGVHAPILAYPAAFGLIALVIFFIYGNRGWKVVFSVMTYLTALSTMKLTVKWVFVECAFTFPKFVTVLHFVCGGLVCLAVLLKDQSRIEARAIAVPTLIEFFCIIVPIAMAASVSIACNNMALGFSSVAFTEIIGATTCLFTVALVVILGMPFDKWLLVPTVAVVMGCALSTAGEVNFSSLGLILCLASNAFRSTKVALQQKLMTGESKDKFDPCTLLMWVSVPSGVMMLFGSLITEGLAPYRQMASMDRKTIGELWMALGVSCANAVVLNLAQLFVTKELGAVGSTLVSQAKAVLTVLGGMVVFGESVTVLELVGFAEVLVGVYVYSAMEMRAKQRRAIEQKKQEQAVAYR
eukprot:CAMPEP_0176041320 /NCGR_PEP_ID=MMETSP0120_2-20121206/20494_1 /TAXON_ID=160619 /ORGANISM="Kryptoperidinium foliaceum, Strain CCMP 1326" /LENGTH=419 /DNA_ID=CAMNT_0017374721 /DNA_START=133 /DNA_END=1392 /DNA_ORIENTATION=+